MARKRMIDPSFWTDEKIGECKHLERLLFLGLVSNADDEGIGRGNPKLLMSLIFPYDDIRISDFKKSLEKLSSLNMITFYDVENQMYYKVNNFSKYQSINRPSPSEFPKFCGQKSSFTEHSLNTHGAFNANIKEEKISKDNLKKENCIKEKASRKYGQYGNVCLSDDDFEKLQAEFPNDYTDRIENLSSYMASTGNSYKNHLATIRRWAKKETDTPKTSPSKNKFNNYSEDRELSDFEKQMLKKRFENEDNS